MALGAHISGCCTAKEATVVDAKDRKVWCLASSLIVVHCSDFLIKVVEYLESVREKLPARFLYNRDDEIYLNLKVNNLKNQIGGFGADDKNQDSRW